MILMFFKMISKKLKKNHEKIRQTLERSKLFFTIEQFFFLLDIRKK